jgi:hypothetical protein
MLFIFFFVLLSSSSDQLLLGPNLVSFVFNSPYFMLCKGYRAYLVFNDYHDGFLWMHGSSLDHVSVSFSFSLITQLFPNHIENITGEPPAISCRSCLHA